MDKDYGRDPITAEIKRKVRTDAGFGCVICGMPIIEYHHIIPYAQVKKHEADNLVPLCDLHHKKFHQHLIPVEEITKAKANPFNLTTQTIKDNFMLSNYKDLRIKMGSNIFINTQKVIAVNDFPLIEIKKDELNRPLLNVKFFDDNNVLIAEVIDNEWIVMRESEKIWDLTWTSGKLKINSSLKKIFLELQINAIENTIELRADLFYKNVSIKIRPNSILINNKRMNGGFQLTGNVFESMNGIDIDISN